MSALAWFLVVAVVAVALFGAYKFAVGEKIQPWTAAKDWVEKQEEKNSKRK